MHRNFALGLYFAYVICVLLIDNFFDNGILVNICSVFLVFYSGVVIFYTFFKDQTHDRVMLLVTTKFLNLTFLLITIDLLCRSNDDLKTKVLKIGTLSWAFIVFFVVIYVVLDGYMQIGLLRDAKVADSHSINITPNSNDLIEVERDDDEEDNEEEENVREVSITTLPHFQPPPSINPTLSETSLYPNLQFVINNPV